MSKIPGKVSPDRLMQMAWGYAAPLMIETGLRLALFDTLANGPKTIDQLTAETAANPRGLIILLNALAGLGLLNHGSGATYALTPESETFLVRGKPSYLGGMLKHTSTQLLPRWLQLTDIVRTGRPAMAVNQEGPGSAFFQEFVADLFPFNFGAATTLADALEVAKATDPLSVLDLAAGSGVWGIALAKKSPFVYVTAIDWPAVLTVCQDMVRHHNLERQFSYRAGDLAHVDFGQSHHIATLGHILHSEGVVRSRQLLARTYDALAPGGTIAIAEWIVEPDRSGPPMGLIFAVNMLVNTDQGDTFSLPEMREWLEEVGFEKVRTLDIPGPSPLILANKPS